MKRLSIICGFLMTMSLTTAQTYTLTDLEKDLRFVTNPFPGRVGISFVSDHGDTIGINAENHFPMMSVMKFPQALAVCHILDSLNTPLNTLIHVDSSSLNPNTYSPMLKKYPKGGDLSYRELLDYSLIQSDNNASNILYNVPPANVHYVNRFAHSMIEERDTDAMFHILYSEETMGMNVNRARMNWMSPFAATRLMSTFFDTRNANDYNKYLWKTMSKCKTGEKRIPRHIKDRRITIVHKTGTGGVLPDGTVFAVNDVACIVLPNGRYYFLSVFIADAHCEMSYCEEFIANISQIVYEYITE